MPSGEINLTGTRIAVTAISAAMGACFAMLAVLSIRAAVEPARRFHISSVVIAVLAVCLAILAFREAASESDDERMISSLRLGMFGAFLAFVLICVLLFMFGDHTRSFLAHALSMPTSSFPTPWVLIACVVFGFGVGFVLRAAALHGRNSS
jgi:small-conductance mechanosensitive channel